MSKRRLLRSYLVSVLFSFMAATVFSQTPFWQQTDGPEGGDVFGLVVLPQGDVIAAVKPGYIYRSTDNGASWTLLSRLPAMGGQVSNLARNPATGSLFVAVGFALMRSDDNGASWAQTDFYPYGVVYLAITPAGAVFAGAPGVSAVFRSTDDGNSWTTHQNGLPPAATVTSLAVDPLGGVYAGLDGFLGVYRSIDNGNTWVQVGSPGQVVRAFGVDPNGRLYAFTQWPGGGRVFRSVDSGATWEDVGSPTPYAWNGTFAFGVDGQVFAGTSGGLGGTETMGVYRLNDQGAWSYIGPTAAQISNLAVNPSGDLFVGTAGDGVYRSSDSGSAWARLTEGMRATDVYSLLFTPTDRLLVAARRAGVHVSDDKGQTWSFPSPRPSLMNFHFNFFPCPVLARASAGRVFFATGGMYFEGRLSLARSQDDGQTWEESLGPVAPEMSGFTTCVVVDHRDYVYTSSFHAGVLRSTDGGDSWHSLGLAPGPGGGPGILSLAVTSAGTILASGVGYAPEEIGVFRLADGEQIWTRIDLNGANCVWDLTVSPNGHIFAASNVDGLSRSTDDGRTWVPVTAPSNTPLAVNAEGRLFTASDATLFSSLDDGQTWTEHYDPSFTGRFGSFAFDSDGYLYAGTWGGGVWRSLATTFLVKTVVVDIKPGSYPNAINLGSNGTVPVAILSDSAFDATTVDPLTVTLAGATVKLRGKGTPMSSCQDVNTDGRLDLVVHVTTEALELTETSVEAILEGATYGGRRIKGSDTVKVVP
jgi:photosystem II stability/assembly factor-like uncharacterized protein